MNTNNTQDADGKGVPINIILDMYCTPAFNWNKCNQKVEGAVISHLNIIG